MKPWTQRGICSERRKSRLARGKGNLELTYQLFPLSAVNSAHRWQLHSLLALILLLPRDCTEKAIAARGAAINRDRSCATFYRVSMKDIEQDGCLSLSEEDGNIFKEPEGFYEPEKQPTCVSYQTLNGQVLSLRLIGHSPLWVGDRISYFLSWILRMMRT